MSASMSPTPVPAFRKNISARFSTRSSPPEPVGQGTGLRTRDRLRHRQADQRLHHRRKRHRQRHGLSYLSAALSCRRKRCAHHRAGTRRSARCHGAGHDPAGRRRRSGARGARYACAATKFSKRRAAKRRWRSCAHTQQMSSSPDVVMPNMDGPTLVRAVKKPAPRHGRDLHVGLCQRGSLSGRNDEKAEDLHFLPKPFGLKQLAAKVKSVLAAGVGALNFTEASSRYFSPSRCLSAGRGRACVHPIAIRHSEVSMTDTGVLFQPFPAQEVFRFPTASPWR